LANSDNPCRCSKKIDFLIDQGNINAKGLRFAQFTKRSIDLVQQIGALEKATAIYRSTPAIPTPKSILKIIKETILIE